MSDSHSTKREAHVLNGTPDKRLFWSIINDYDLKTALCELIDNAVDVWFAKKNRGILKVDVELDHERQTIAYKDNAGGVAEKDLRLLISPGGSNVDPNASTIGVFGIGSKRATVALAEAIRIKTRAGNDKTYQIDIDKDWLSDPTWNISSYEIAAIGQSETHIDLSVLRRSLSIDDEPLIRSHFSEIYGWYLEIDDFELSVNGIRVKPAHFENWSYPSGYPPREINFEINVPDSKPVEASLTGGLIYDRVPDTDNYGVYVYCNNRLIAKELKNREAGYYVSTEAGVPHPDASLCRVVIRLSGSAKTMPWNSSKTGITFSHPVFIAMRPRLIEIVSYYSKLSRRLKHEWDEKVFRHKNGKIEVIKDNVSSLAKRLHLPQLPSHPQQHIETIKSINAPIVKEKPWTLGLVESVAILHVITNQRLETKNRVALIVLDSTLEIALKEFIVNENLAPKGQTLESLFGNRPSVINVVERTVSAMKPLRKRIDHYYRMRCKLIHERITVDVTPSDVAAYEVVVKEVLNLLYGLKFGG